ncbi:pyridoxamine 5'-phosphate oxidase family protein [soil metagenome]
MEDNKKDVADIAKMIKGQHVCMLTTINGGGQLHSRPMGVQDVEFTGSLWFMTSDDTHKMEEIERNSHACAAFSDESSSTYVCLSGDVTATKDRAKIDEFWSPLYKAWFPQGKDDPKITLLHLNVERAEYWDAPGGRMVQLLLIVKKAITGHGSEGSHGTVELH